VARRKLAVQACEADPLELVRRMRAWDQREKREFELCSDEWAWQMDLLRWWVENPKSIILKARQLGCTWMAVAYAVWTVLYEPGANVLMYRQTEEDAKGLVFRFKQLLNSLPDYLWNGGKVVKETETQVHLEFPDGRVSLLRAMASTSAAGHGETVALAILDEFSRIDRAGDIMKSVLPAVGTKGRVCIISTANGRFNEQTGAGNHFHYLWEHAEESGIARRFLSWQAHPDRDQDWYDTSPEIQGLAPHERAEQYPSNPHEAFMFSNSLYFDKAALLWYAENAVKEPEFTGRFVRSGGKGKAEFRRSDSDRLVSVFQKPVEGREYVLAADVASGRGLDYSAAYVLDLETMAVCAELHGRVDTDLYAEQLHFLGRWFNTARLAVEDAGGWGEPVIVFLRDGKDGRPPYPQTYRHRQWSRGDLPEHKPFGFPMNVKNRPLVLEGLERALRERAFPYLSRRLVDEMGSFVHRDSNPSPRAQDGSNDDCVMALAIGCELWRQFAKHPGQWRSGKPKRRAVPSYPWQQVAA
jgi:hypothetical protein